MECLGQEEQILYLEELGQQKDLLLSSVTHDLRTPLNAINYSLNEIECATKGNDRAIKHIKISRCNSDMLMNLINDLLDYSQIKANKMNLVLENFSFSEALQEIEDMLVIQFQLKKVKLLFKNNIPYQNEILSDKRRLKQVIVNLLTNALKFTTEGQVKVLCDFYQQEKNLIKIEVKDTGIGIKENVISQLGTQNATFNDFNLNASGIGLGLFISKKIIGKLGPQENFNIKSKYGHGSSFSFLIFSQLNSETNYNFDNFKLYSQEKTLKKKNQRVSLKKHCCQEEKNQLNNDCSEGVDIQLDKYISTKIIKGSLCQQLESYSYVILIVDDNMFNILILEKFLQHPSLPKLLILKAYDGKQAEEIFCKYNQLQSNLQKIDIIIMDCLMPIQDGYATAQKIKGYAQNGNWQDCIILAHTCNTGEAEEMRCRNAGYDGYLFKPTNQENLIFTIQKNLVV